MNNNKNIQNENNKKVSTPEKQKLKTPPSNVEKINRLIKNIKETKEFYK